MNKIKITFILLFSAFLLSCSSSKQTYRKLNEKLLISPEEMIKELDKRLDKLDAKEFLIKVRMVDDIPRVIEYKIIKDKKVIEQYKGKIKKNEVVKNYIYN